MAPSARALLTSAALILAGGSLLEACTNLLVTKGASKDGATMITYAADSHELYGELYFKRGGRHLAGETRDIVEWDTGKFLGRIAQAPVTYTRVGNMNQFQVAIGETTFGGRKELAGPAGIIDYGSLIYTALERSKTAKEAIDVMTQLVDQYGYASTGESFSIADANEVWILEMIGKGKDAKGAVWVAVKLPDGVISGHANQARIRHFDPKDTANVRCSKDVISFARDKGFFKGEDKDFSFADTYAPLRFGALRGCEARVWSLFRRAAPSLNLGPEYVRPELGLKRLPLWVKPDRKLDVRDAMALMRDHYEGTDFDMTQDVGAGPFALPYRWRPMGFQVDGQDYVHERAISTQQTGFSFVTQSRAWLPNEIGGVLWFGMDDTFTTVYSPVYCGVKEVPKAFAEGTGSFESFSWDSAFWVFSFVTNWTYTKWNEMIVDVQKVQREWEGRYAAEQPEVERTALELHKQDPGRARDFLTAQTSRNGEELVARWRKLGEFLMWKYMDGNVRDEHGKVTHPRYPDSWYRRIVKDKGEVLKVRKIENAPAGE